MDLRGREITRVTSALLRLLSYFKFVKKGTLKVVVPNLLLNSMLNKIQMSRIIFTFVHLSNVTPDKQFRGCQNNEQVIIMELSH